MSGTRDLTPSVGVIGPCRNIYYGVGYFEGVPTAQTAGRMISDLMARDRNEFTEHHVVNRNIPYLGPQWFRNLAIPIYKKLLTRLARDGKAIR